MSYPTILIIPALLWWYAIVPDTAWPLDTLAVLYFVALTMSALYMVDDHENVLKLFRDSRKRGDTLPLMPLRAASHMLALGACMELGGFATCIQLAYSVVYEVTLEMSHEPA